MILQTSPYFIAMVISGFISLLLAGTAAKRRNAAGWSYFAFAMLAVGGWSLAYALQIAVRPLGIKIFFNNLAFAGAHSLAPLWFLFALSYLNHHNQLNSLRKAALFVVPTLMTGMALTNAWHGLVWRSISLTTINHSNLLAFEYGPIFWIGAAYAYALILAGSITLGRGILRSPTLIRTQTGIIITAAVIPWVSNLLYITNLNPFPGLDMTPPSFALSGILVTSALFRYHLLDLIPVAYDTLFANMENEVFVLDSNSRLIEANPAAQLLFALDDSILGQPVEAWLAHIPELVEKLREMDCALDEVQLSTKDGPIWRSVQWTPLTTNNQAVIGRLVVLNDITARKQAEVKLKTAHEQALAGSQMKTQLLASVSHDLRSPLGAIMGFSDMLRTGIFGDVNPEQKRALEQILDSASQQLNYVNNLIGQAQLETGRIQIEKRAFPFDELLDSLKSTTGLMAAHKGLTLTYAAQTGLPTHLYGDPYWLRQILLNLVNNAIKFTQQGQVAVRLALEGRDHWSLIVEDNGIGIPADKIETIFEPFRQLRNQGEQKLSGSGLGLSIVKQLTDLMGGCIEVTSQPGAGSSFKIILPLQDAIEIEGCIGLQTSLEVSATSKNMGPTRL